MRTRQGPVSASAAKVEKVPASAPIELIDSLLESGRIWVALAARALSKCKEDVTLRQFRVLVIVGASGPVRLTDLAHALLVDSSTASRLCDQLVRKKMVARRQSPTSRREVQIELSASGKKFLDTVNQHRRAEVNLILRHLPPGAAEPLLTALRQFSQAAEQVEFAALLDG